LEEEESKKKEAEVSLERTQEVATGIVNVDEDASITPGWDEDQDDEVTEEQKIKIRTEMILTRVWQEYDARMYTKQTTKLEFFDANAEKARTLAIAELKEDYVNGDLGFDPLGFKPSNEDSFNNIRTKELQIGRLAMLGVAGIVAQELVCLQYIYIITIIAIITVIIFKGEWQRCS
jgi:hypothetical protein